MENESVLFGVIAIVGAIGVGIGDAFLLGNPVSGKQFRAQKLKNLSHVSPRNMFIGHTLGVWMVPFVFFGVFQVYRGLEPAGAAYALPPVLIMIYILVMGAAGHACFAFLGGAYHLQDQLGDETNERVNELIERNKRLLYPLFGVFLLGMIVSSLWFSVTVWTQPSFFPKWMGFVNPFFLIFTLGRLENLLPAPIGGYIRPANANIGLAIFFLFTTIALS
jgi:hypothetical protein